MSFRIKSLLVLASIQSLLLMGIMWIAYSGYVENQTTLHIDHLKREARTVAVTLSDAVARDDLTTLIQSVKAVQESAGLAYVRLKDSRGNVLAAVGDKNFLSRPFSADHAYSLAVEDDGMFDQSVGIRLDDETIGHVELGLDLSQDQVALRELRRFALQIFIGVLALMVVATAIVLRWMTRPLSQLMEAVTGVGRGDFSASLPATSQKEINKLVSAIESMREQVIESQQILESNANREANRAELIMEHVPDAIIAMDKDGIVQDVNPIAEKIFDYTRTEMIGQHTENLLANGKHKLAGLSLLPSSRFEAQGLRKDGSHFPIEMAIGKTEINDEPLFIAVIDDISLRKKNEAELMFQRQLIEIVSRAQADFIRSGDPAELFKTMLPAILSMTQSNFGFIGEYMQNKAGRSFLKAYGLNMKLQQADVAELFEQNALVGFELCELDNLLGQTLLTGEPVVSHDASKEFRSNDTPFESLQLNTFLGLPIYAGKRILGTLALANRPGGYDKKVINQLKPLLDTCAQLLDAFCRERDRRLQRKNLQIAKSTAEAANRAKSQFLAIMSHEIRTPMNGVLGMLELLNDSELSSKQQRFVNNAVNSGKLLLKVINDILDVSKLDADKLELEHIVFDPVELIEESVHLMSQSADEQGLEIICAPESQLPRAVKGDPTRLRQVLINLISNALKFTKQGDVAVYAMPIDKTGILFGVRDTGIGITQEQQGRLFHSFTQVDSSHTRKFGGTGLGLVICQQLVKAMGGNIQVASAPGLGSDFSFILPLKAVEDTAQKLPGNALMPKRVLVVDDNQSNSEVLAKWLRAWHVNVVEKADSGPEGLKLLHKAAENGQYFDVALLDWQMPSMNGLELAEAIHEEPAFSDMRLVILGSNAKKVASSVKVDWIEKPVRQGDLLEMLSSKAEFVEKQPETTSAANNAERYCFDGRVLLLVEDNPINQEFARVMLSRAGFVIDICDNGAQGLKAVQQKDYDAVLMDIHMPVMDGLEAVRQIRLLGGSFEKLPVIAMTANAFVNDRDKSIAAGMNEHVTKPISPEILLGVLAQYMPPGSRTVAEKKIQNIKEIAKTMPNLPGIDVCEGLSRLRGSEKAYRRILLSFRDKYSGAADQIKVYIEQGEWEEARHVAHSLKGSGGNLGAKQLYSVASCMEQICQASAETGRTDEAFKALAELRSSLLEVTQGLVHIDNIVASKAPLSAEARVVDSSIIKELLEKIEGFLESDLGEAQACLDALQQQVIGTDYVDKLSELEHALNDFDIEAAKIIARNVRDAA